ncbi:MAG: hypothetical protein AAB946_00105 [Patescibacteria group bacterium]
MIKLKHHKTLTLERWQKFSLAEQMGNIGSEVSRAIGAKKRNDEAGLNNAFERGMELFDLSMMDKRHKKRLREIGRAREVFADAFLDGGEYQSTFEGLDKYLLQFALMAKK